jgi:O-antigen ligase
MAPTGDESALFALHPRAILRAAFRQSAAFWLICLYIFFEYVRPQMIYTWMDVAPWALISILGATLLSLLEGRIRFSSYLLWTFISLFCVVILLSSLNAKFPAQSWESMSVWINWMLLMLVVGAGIRTRNEFFLLLLSFLLWNLKMSQHGVRGFLSAGLSFQSSGVSGAPGWFRNSGEFGIEMCVFLPLAGYLTYGLWPRLNKVSRAVMLGLTASALLSMVATSSRGALVGAAGIGLWLVLRSPHRVRALIILLVSSVVVWSVTPSESKARFSEMGEDKTSISRLTYWEHGIEIANDNPVLGIGFKNWLPYYRTSYNPEGELPHNFLIECVAELGYVGLLVLIGLLVAFFLENARTRRRTGPHARSPDRLLWSMAHGLDGAMIGFMISGSFVTVLFYPFLWMNVALTLALAGVAHGKSATRKPVREGPESGRLAQRLPFTRFAGAAH